VIERYNTMSRDIFVQDIPPDARTIDDIPDGFEPRPIGLRRADVVEIAPYADFADPSRGRIDLPGTTMTAFDAGSGWLRGDSIEVNLGDDEEVVHFAFHVRGGIEALRLVARILGRLKLRALDPASDSGFFVDPDVLQQ
jgi:hypothetical protein